MKQLDRPIFLAKRFVKERLNVFALTTIHIWAQQHAQNSGPLLSLDSFYDRIRTSVKHEILLRPGTRVRLLLHDPFHVP